VWVGSRQRLYSRLLLLHTKLIKTLAYSHVGDAASFMAVHSDKAEQVTPNIHFIRSECRMRVQGVVGIEIHTYSIPTVIPSDYHLNNRQEKIVLACMGDIAKPATCFQDGPWRVSYRR